MDFEILRLRWLAFRALADDAQNVADKAETEHEAASLRYRQLSQLEVDELVNEIDRLRAGISVSTRVLVQSEWHYPAWVMELMGDELRRSI